MRLGITTKLYLALLATSVVVIVLLVVAQRMSLRQGFLHYVHRVEVAQVDALIEVLARYHGESQGWEALRGNVPRWRRLLAESARPGTHPHPPPLEYRRHPPGADGDRGFRPRPPRSPLHYLAPRLTLLDAGRAVVTGNPNLDGNSTYRPIKVSGEIVGWLAIAPARELRRPRDVRFMREQHRVALVIAAAALVLAALVAVPLARHLLRPVHQLAHATQTLAAGDLSARTLVDRDDELGQLGRDFNQLAQTLERNEQARRAFMADISHELRTPVAVLRAELDALHDGVRPLTPEAVGSLREEIQLLGKLIEDLYELARTDLGALQYQRAEVDVAALLRRTLEGCRARFEARPIALETDIEPAAITLFADAARLQQLFGNLLENSLRYTDAGGTLRVRCRIADASVCIDFQDSAPVVAAADLDRLFERLFRVDRSRSRAQGGAGLGLAICRNIVEAHGGRISAAASPLGGLWIEVRLPLATSPRTTGAAS